MIHLIFWSLIIIEIMIIIFYFVFISDSSSSWTDHMVRFQQNAAVIVEVKWSSIGGTDLSIHFQPYRLTTSECFSYPYVRLLVHSTETKNTTESVK